jgi:hypothetical protein
MDAHNLAIVIAPVLVRSVDVHTDAELCRVPKEGQEKEASFPWSSKSKPSRSPAGSAANKTSTTLGSMLKLCIENCAAIFPMDDAHGIPEFSSLRASSSSSLQSSQSGAASPAPLSPSSTKVGPRMQV